MLLLLLLLFSVAEAGRANDDEGEQLKILCIGFVDEVEVEVSRVWVMRRKSMRRRRGVSWSSRRASLSYESLLQHATIAVWGLVSINHNEMRLWPRIQ